MAEFVEKGIVLSTKGGVAVVRITPKGICPDTHPGCPVKALAEGGKFITEADNSINAETGDSVMIEMQSPHYYQALILAFLMPLVLAFTGYLVGFLIANLLSKQGESWGYLFMTLGFVSSFLLMALCDKHAAGTTYKIVAVEKEPIPTSSGYERGSMNDGEGL